MCRRQAPQVDRLTAESVEKPLLCGFLSYTVATDDDTGRQPVLLPRRYLGRLPRHGKANYRDRDRAHEAGRVPARDTARGWPIRRHSDNGPEGLLRAIPAPDHAPATQ